MRCIGRIHHSRPQHSRVILSLLCFPLAISLLGQGCPVRPPFDPPGGSNNPDDQRPRSTGPSVLHYFNDFESVVGPEWSPILRDGTPLGDRGYLGRVRNQTFTLRLEDLPVHTAVRVTFDLYVIGSWDGNDPTAGPDIWSLKTGDGRTLFETTFSYLFGVKQSYPNSYPFGLHPGRTGAVENDTLGYSFFDENDVVRQWNSVYQLSSRFEHTSDTLELLFSARNLEEEGEETWGLDNVTVILTLPDDDWETALVIEAEDFQSRAIGGPIDGGWNIWQSGRIADWIQFDPRCTDVQIRARVKGDSANGDWPIMGLTVDQRLEGYSVAPFKRWTELAFDVSVRAGLRQVGIFYTNDQDFGGGQDRNLHVDWIEICVPKNVPTDARPVRGATPSYLAEPDLPETDEGILALARENIEKHRKGDFRIRVVDAHGAPVTSRNVRFDMFRHHFLWGAAADFRFEPSTSRVEEVYRQRLGELFTFITTENLLRWRDYEPARGEPLDDELEAYIDVADRLGLPMKGHNLVWGDFRDFPAWLTEDDIANAEQLVLDRVIRDVKALNSYDVVNEPMHAIQWEVWAGPSYLETVMQTARQANPAAELYINEYEIIGVEYMADNFVIRMRDMMQRGAPLDGIGIQMHSNLGEWYTPYEIYRGLERVSQLELPLHITELSLRTLETNILGGPYDGEPWTRERQAEYYGQAMTVVFGHPSIKSFTFWGFADRRSFQPGTGILDASLQLKPAGEEYVRLVRQEWSTNEIVRTDAEGFADLRGFYGWYAVSLGDRVAVVELSPETAATANGPVEVVLHPFGDADGDGRVDDSDFAAFDACFTGENIGPVLPGCRTFDRDGDRDVDCTDYYAFLNAATTGPLPEFPPCDLPRPHIEATGCRYLTVSVSTGPLPVALYITSDEWFCVGMYVQPNGFLGDEPVFLTGSQWGKVNISDGFIVPSSTYHVQLDTGSHRSERASATTWLWGDTDNDGIRDESDIIRVVDAFHGQFGDTPFQAVDLAGCIANRGIDFADVNAVIGAVNGIDYGADCPAPCTLEGERWEPDE